jgi:hypothetical protein
MDLIRLTHRGEEWEIGYGAETPRRFANLEAAAAFVRSFGADKRSRGRLQRVLQLYDPQYRGRQIKDDVLVATLADLLYRREITVLDEPAGGLMRG